MRGSPQTTPMVTCPEIGLQRVSWVSIVLGPTGPRCEVGGIAHRRPVVRVVPLRTATALAAAGVPAVVRSTRSAEPPAPAPDVRSPAGRAR